MICHEHKFIFIHIPKCAGTSIEKFFGTRQLEVVKHYTAIQYNELYNDEWHDYYKFTVIRNPWDQLVSWWKWRGVDKTFTQWIHDLGTIPPGNDHLSPGLTHFDYITVGNKIAVDYICKFENLAEDFSSVCSTLNISNSNLPHVHKTKHDHYSTYYDDKTRDLVTNIYKHEIEFFGYKFID